MMNLSSPSSIKPQEQFQYANNNLSEIITDLEKILEVVAIERPIHTKDRDIIRRTCDKLRYLRSITSDLQHHVDRGADLEFDFRGYIHTLTELIGETQGRAQNISIVNCCEALGIISDAIDYYHRDSHHQRAGFITRLLTGRK